jgi:hypothetical protein
MNADPRQFTGTSPHGSLDEALELAFQAALAELPTDFVRWRLLTVTGEYGGITEQRRLTATISATGPSGNP